MWFCVCVSGQYWVDILFHINDWAVSSGCRRPTLAAEWHTHTSLHSIYRPCTSFTHSLCVSLGCLRHGETLSNLKRLTGFVWAELVKGEARGMCVHMIIHFIHTTVHAYYAHIYTHVNTHTHTHTHTPSLLRWAGLSCGTLNVCVLNIYNQCACWWIISSRFALYHRSCTRHTHTLCDSMC